MQGRHDGGEAIPADDVPLMDGKPDKDWLRAAIGPHADEYLSRFEKIESRGAWVPTWHWPAFFFSTAWFFYRGLNSWAILNAFLVALAASFLVAPMGGIDLELTALGVFAVLAAILPAYANQIYHHRLGARFAGSTAASAQAAAAAMRPASSNVGLAGAALLAAMLIATLYFPALLVAMSMVPGDQYIARGQVSELAAVASSCKGHVAEFYQARGRMPADQTEVPECKGTYANAEAPRVKDGVITVAATPRLRSRLEAHQSGWELHSSPTCEGGPCTGKPIVAWDCRSGTTIAKRFLPEACR